MRESKIEHDVTEHARKCGWLAYKWVSPNNRGVPDRLFFKNGKFVIVEFKAPGKKPTPLQRSIHNKLNKQGFFVHVIDSVEDGIGLFS